MSRHDFGQLSDTRRNLEGLKSYGPSRPGIKGYAKKSGVLEA